MFRSVILFFLLLAGFIHAHGQQNCECSLKGIVKDSLTKEGVAGVVVLIKGTDRAMITGADGSYNFKNLCPITYQIEARLVGYKPKTFTIELTHPVEEASFTMTEETIHLNGIDIVAERVESVTKSVETMQQSAMQARAGESLGQTIQQMAGVTLLQTGNSIAKPVIHGMHSNRILIYANGVRLESQQWGSEHAPEIDPNSAQKVTLIKGASGVRYGADAVAGIIKLEPTFLFREKRELQAGLQYFSNGNQLGSSFRWQQPIGQWPLYISVQASGKKGGDISTPSYRMANTGLQELNVMGRLGYERRKSQYEVSFAQFNSKIGIFSGSHLGNTSDLITAINRSQPLSIYTPSKFTYNIGRPYQDLQHSTAKVSSNFKLTPNFSVDILAARQQNFRREVDILRGDKNLSQTFQLVTYQTEAIANWRVNKSLATEFGWQSSLQTNLSTGSVKKPLRSSVIIPNYTGWQGGGFISAKKQWAKWEFEAGTRLETRNLHVYYLNRQLEPFDKKHTNTQVVGTIGAAYQPSEILNIYSSFSTAWRPASINEWYSDGVHHGTASYELGNLNLQPEHANNLVVGGNLTTKRWFFDLSLYQHRIQNFIFLSPTGQTILTIRGAFPLFVYQQTEANFKGLDATVKWTANKWAISSKTSLLQADDLSNKQPLIFISPNRNVLKVSYALPTNFLKEVSLEHTLVAQQRRYPTKILSNADVASPIIFNGFGGDYLAPPKGYQLVAAQLTADYQQFHLDLQVKNLFNTQYRDYLNRFRYFSDEMGRNIQVRLLYQLH